MLGPPKGRVVSIEDDEECSAASVEMVENVVAKGTADRGDDGGSDDGNGDSTVVDSERLLSVDSAARSGKLPR